MYNFLGATFSFTAAEYIYGEPSTNNIPMLERTLDAMETASVENVGKAFVCVLFKICLLSL